jgi:ubiquinone/menaquinone biosynthesis C-methylase UbiE
MHEAEVHLRQHMGGPPQRVVGVGGGAGNQSIPLALAGNEVTIVDPSPAMLERATRRLAEEDERVARRV